LVRADGRVHVVRPGDRVGQDRGRVLRIGERHIELREWVRDESGAWHERDNRIEMREAAR
jgi:Tfp pilus assembly protein PilP